MFYDLRVEREEEREETGRKEVEDVRIPTKAFEIESLPCVLKEGCCVVYKRVKSMDKEACM